MAVSSMVPHENLTYVGSNKEPCIATICIGAFRTSPASSMCIQANEPSLYIRRRMLSIQFSLNLGSSPSNPAYNTVFNPKFNASFSSKPTQIPTLGIRIAPELEKIGFKRNTVSRLSIPATIGGAAIEARRHVPPQILGPGGTLWIVPLPILASSFVIILAVTSLSLAYCTEGTFAIHFATEAIYCIAHKATGGAYRRLLCFLNVNASTIMSPPAAAAVMTITVIH